MQHDYFMREIEGMTNALAELLFGEHLDENRTQEVVVATTSAHELRLSLMFLLAQGRVNEAENLLFEHVANDPGRQHLRTALDFYEKLAAMDDDALREADFSREEILDGMREIQAMYRRGH